MKILWIVLATLFLSIRVMAFDVGKGVQAMHALSGVGSAMGASASAKSALENGKKCKASGGKDQTACNKATLSGGQMLSSLAGVASAALSALSSGSKSGDGESFAGLTLNQVEQAEETPLSSFSDQDTAERLLSGSKLTPGQVKDIVAASQIANDLGVEVNEGLGTITSETSEVRLSALGSSAGLSKLGFTPEEIKDLLSAQASLAKKVDGQLQNIKLGAADGGSVGRKKARSDFKFSDFSSYSATANGSLANELGRKEIGSNFSRNLAGEPIGVMTGNIFHMISRRYQKKIKEHKFLP